MSKEIKRGAGGNDSPQTPANVVTYPALSIIEPWASLIADGKKQIEIRYWGKSFITRVRKLVGSSIAIHTSSKWDSRAAMRLHYELRMRFNRDDHPLQVVIALATLEKVIIYDSYNFARDWLLHLNELSPINDMRGDRQCVGLKFVDVERIPINYYKGRLGFFPVQVRRPSPSAPIRAVEQPGPGRGGNSGGAGEIISPASWRNDE